MIMSYNQMVKGSSADWAVVYIQCNANKWGNKLSKIFAKINEIVIEILPHA